MESSFEIMKNIQIINHCCTNNIFVDTEFNLIAHC